MELTKHHLTKHFSKMIIIIFLLVLVLLVSSSYLLSNELIKTDNKLILTSAAIYSNIKENVNVSDLVNTTKVLDTRNFYK